MATLFLCYNLDIYKIIYNFALCNNINMHKYE
nr:MAG TPA: hypothetical protein [Crassvirales sp.]